MTISEFDTQPNAICVQETRLSAQPIIIVIAGVAAKVSYWFAKQLAYPCFVQSLQFESQIVNHSQTLVVRIPIPTFAIKWDLCVGTRAK